MPKRPPIVELQAASPETRASVCVWLNETRRRLAEQGVGRGDYRAGRHAGAMSTAS